MMVRTASIALLITALVIQPACWNRLYPQQVVNLSDSSQTLLSRWQHARHEASARSFSGGYWIGYLIKKVMDENSFVGSYSSDPGKNKPTLREVITGIKQEHVEPLSGRDFEGEMEGEFSFENGGSYKKQILKEIGILVHIRTSPAPDIDEVKISNLSLHVSLNDDPLIWIGSAPGDESVDFLQSVYAQVPSADVRKKIIIAVGIHHPTEKVFQFLRSILLGSDIGDLRKEATFWIGRCNTDDAVILLEQRIHTDPAAEVREQSVFVLGEMENKKAVESLIRMARDEGDETVRKNAVFWLGQKVSVKLSTADHGRERQDENTEIKKKAVFALSRFTDNRGLEALINVARGNDDLPVRREAVFWLSQLDNKLALDALIDILRN